MADEIDLVNAPDNLTVMQILFAREFLVDLNQTAAAIRAGYSEKTAVVIASQLMSKPHVRAYIQELMNQRAERTRITPDYVLATIADTVERCRQNRPVLDKKGKQVYVTTPDGDELPAFVFDAKGVLKGAELLGKHLKLFTDVQEHQHVFTQMKTVEVIDPSNPNAAPVALAFDIGQDPDRPQNKT